MVIQSAGNVGIGTTSPAATLEVNGTAKFDSTVTFAAGQTFPGSGTVTSVGSGSGLTGGPITSSGALSIASGGVTNAMLANPSLTVTAGTDLTGGGSVALGSGVTLNLDTTKVPTLGASSNTFTGSVTASSFTGSGAGLTSLTPANLSAGTAGISITGNAATATTAASATNATTATTATSATNATNAMNASLAANSTNLGGVAYSNYARLDIANSFASNQNVAGNLFVGSGTPGTYPLEVQANGTDALTVASSGAVTLGTSASPTRVTMSGANTDFAGTISISSAISGYYQFSGTGFVSTPVCVVTPTSNLGSVTWYINVSNTQLWIYLSGAATVTFNYICVGNPN
jgi:hypothetical protein